MCIKRSHRILYFKTKNETNKNITIYVIYLMKNEKIIIGSVFVSNNITAKYGITSSRKSKN